jgi:hypothetical protein
VRKDFRAEHILEIVMEEIVNSAIGIRDFKIVEVKDL